MSFTDTDRKSQRIERVKHRHVFREIQQAAAIVWRQTDVFDHRTMHHEIRLTEECAVIARKLHRRAGFGWQSAPTPKGMCKADRGEQAVARAAHDDSFCADYPRVAHGGRDMLAHHAT